MANFLNEIIESTIQPVKTNVLWIKNGVPYYYNKRWKPLLGGASGGTVDSPITFGEGEYSAILNYSNNNALGSRSIALGYNTTSYNNYEASFGKYNKSVKSEDLTKATLFSVGNGNATFPKNALEIKWDGSVYISGIDKSVQDYLSSIKTYDSEINDILESIKELSDRITITDSKLETKFEEFEEGINGELEEYYSKLTQTAKEIRAEVGSITTELDGRITENTALISITAKEIRSEVSEITTDLDGRIETNKSSISQTAKEIRAEVSRVQTDLSGRIDTANSTISQTADAIRLEVEAVEGELNGKIERNTSLINQTAESIGLEVINLSDHLNDVNSELAGLIAENKAAIEINANEIKNKVSSDTFNAFSGEVQNQFTEVSTTVEGVKTSVQNIDGKLTEVNATVNGVTTRLGTAEADIESLKKQSDGSIDTHFGTEVPTLNNEPAVNWVTDDLKNEHTGDIYYNNNTGEAYRFSYNPETNEYFWIELTDSALTDALDKISKLESAVDGKVTIFYTTPTNYKYGDMWFVHEDNASFKKGTLVSATNLDKGTIRATLVLADWKEEIEYVNFDELTEELTSLNDYIDNAFKDGVLSEAEIKHIQELKKNFQLSYKEINDLNSFLIITAFATEENKTALNNAKRALDTAFNELIDAIDNLNTELDEDGNNPSLVLYNKKYQAYLKALDDYTEIAVLIQSEAEQELLKPSDYIKQISSDGYLTSIEKKQLIAVWKQIAEEFTANRGIAFNYKILKKEGNNYIDRTDIYDVDTGYHTIYNNYKNSYEAIASIFTDETDPFGFKDLQNTTILSETTIESLASIEQLFDTYYANLALFSEMISKISNDITDAHQKVIDVTNALVDQLDPREAITQIGTGVVLSSVLGVKDIDGNLEAVLNGSDSIEEAQSTKHGNHGKIVFAGGINGSSKWDNATTIIYEDGHVVINSGEISDFVSIGNATFKNVVEAVTQFDVISSPHVNPDTGEIEYIPLFQVNRNDAGEIIYVSSVYDFVGNREISALGFNAGGGSSGGGLISKVYNVNNFGNITDTTNTATFNAYAIDSLHKRIKNLEESEVDLTGYATEEWVMGRGFITASALAPYLKTSDFETWKTGSFNPVVSQVNTNKNNIAEILKWFAIDGDGNLYTTYNFYSTKEISSGGFDSGSNGTGGLIGVVYGKSAFGTIANEANNATFNAYAIDSLYKRIVSLENKEVDLTGYATESWVAGQGFITSAALSPYMKTADANDTFATKTALNNLSSSHDSLAKRVSTADGNIRTNAKGIADNKTAIATNKSNISANAAAISNNAKAISANTTAINTNATAITNLGKKVTANEGNIAKILKWFAVDSDGNLYTTYNFYSTKELSANGLSIGSGGSGGGLISQVYGTTAFGTIAAESNSATFNAYAIDSLYKRIVSLEGKATAVSFVPALTSGKQIGTLSIDGVSTVLYGVDAYSKADADGRYLKLSGGKVSGEVKINGKGSLAAPLIIETPSMGYSGYIQFTDGRTDIGWLGFSNKVAVIRQGTTNNTLIHSNNYSQYALPLTGGSITGGVGALSIKRTSSNAVSLIKYENNDGALGYLGISSDKKPIWYNQDLSDFGYLYHSGNFNPANYLPLTGGSIVSSTTGCPLYLANTKETWNVIGFKGNSHSDYAYFGLRGDGSFFVTGTGWNGTYNLIHSGNYNSYALPLTGGTISGSGDFAYVQLRIKGASIPNIMFEVGSSEKGAIGWTANEGMRFTNAASSSYLGIKDNGTPHFNGNTLIHSGNIGSQNAGSANMLKYIGQIGASGFNANTDLAGGGFIRNYGSSSWWGSSVPSTLSYGVVWQLQGSPSGADLAGQLAWDVNHRGADSTRSLWWRASDDTAFANAKWHQIAFTDSNVASADVIATAYANQSIDLGREGKVRMIYGTASNATSLGYPRQYTSGLSVLTGYTGWQMVTYGGTSIPNPYFRSLLDNGTFSDWKQLAFLDDNVASATKLQTARTIWGQSFDGSGNVSGNITLGAASIRGYDNRNILESTANDLMIGYGYTTSSLKTTIFGNIIKLNDAVLINSSGNVTIGSSDLAGTSAKLYVNGKIVGATFVETEEYGIGNASYGLSSGLKGLALLALKGNIFMPLGNVGIGTYEPQYKLHVAGTARVSGETSIGGTLGITGVVTANSGIKVASGQALTFLDASGKEHKLTYDSTAGAFKFDGNILVVGDGQFNAIN